MKTEDKLLHIDENQIKSALGDILFTRIHFSLVRELELYYRDSSYRFRKEKKQQLAVILKRR